MTERALVVNFIGNDADLQAAMKRTAASLTGLQTVGSKMQSLGSSLSRNVTLPIVALAGASADMASEFEAAMETLHTQAGVSQKAVGSLSAAVLKMAGQVGEAPSELAAGMYHVTSSLNATLPAISRQATELKVLRIAAEGARTGHADLVDVTNALDAAVVSGIKGVQNFSQAMGNMNSTVGAGDMTMQDLADAFGTGLLAPMKRFGLSLQEIDGALAVFGDNNIRGAQAGTKLSSAIRIMAAPSDAAAKALASIGLGSLTLANDLRQPNGLVKAFSDLQQHLQDSGDTASEQALVITRAFGGRQSQGVQILLNQLDRLKAKTAEAGTGATNFGNDWSATQQTAAQKTADALSLMKADLTQFGEDVLPPLLNIGTTIVSDVDQVAQAFERLPSGAQNAIIDGGLLLAAIGPALKILGLFTSGLGQLYSISTKLKGIGAISSVAGGGSAVAGRSISSSVAEMSVGTLVAKSMVGGAGSIGARNQPFGLGKTSAPTTAAGATAVETSMTETSLLASLKSGLGTVLGRGLQGLVIGGVGSLVANAVGSAIHGSVGDAVKSIGGDTAIGAGLGAFFGPAGIAGGAVIGGLVGTFEHFIGHDAEAEGQAWADKFVKGLGPGVSSGVKKALAQGGSPGAAPSAPSKNNLPLLGPGLPIPGESGNPTRIVLAWSQQLIKFVTFARDQGVLAGQAFTQSMGSVKFPSQGAIVEKMQAALSQVPRSVQTQGALAVQNWRDTAAQQMLAYSTSLEQHGKLPKGAVDNMIASLEQSFPGLTSYLDISGQQTEAVIAKSMTLTEARKNWTAALDDFRVKWGFTEQFATTTNANIETNTQTAMSDLKQIIATGTSDQRTAAKKELDLMESQSEKAYSDMTANVAAKQAAMTRSIANGSASAAAQAGTNLAGYEQNVYQAMSAGLLTSNQGASLITKALNATLKAFGSKPIPLPTAVSGLSAPGKALHAGANAARGGLWQFGSAGARGRDDIPVNFGGRSIMVGSGEVGAVMNKDQQAFINARTADVGGLPGVFSKFNRPHYMAGGGMVPGFAAGGVVGEVDQFFSAQGFNKIAIAGLLGNAMQESSLNPNTPGGGMWQQISNFGSGTGGSLLAQMQKMLSQIMGLRALMNASGSAGAAAVIFEEGFEHAGIPAMANRIRYAQEALAGTLSPGSGALTGGPSFEAIAAPVVKGAGTIADLVRAALGKETSAANAYGKKHAAAASAISGSGSSGNFGPLPTGGGFSPSQLTSFDGVTVAKWIDKELLYGRAHGWTGPITSGYRPGFDPHAPSGSEHALDIYPGGAVDFGGMVDPAGLANKLAFMRAVAGYPAADKLIPAEGFRDDGHMSGTGHARGGMLPFAGSFHDGGVIPGPVGREAMARVRSGEVVLPGFSKGGWNPSGALVPGLAAGAGKGTFPGMPGNVQAGLHDPGSQQYFAALVYIGNQIAKALSGLTHAFSVQQTNAQNVSGLAGVLQGVAAGTSLKSLGLTGAGLKASGLSKHQAQALVGGGTAGFGALASIDQAQAGVYAQQAASLKKKYADALKDHNKNLAKKILGQLDTVDQAMAQAISAGQAALVQQVQAKAQSFSDASSAIGATLSTLQGISGLTGGESLSSLGLSPAILKTLGLGSGAQGLVGSALSNYQTLAGNQGGALTAAQMQQATAGVNAQNQLVYQQESPLESELSYYQSQLGSLTGTNKSDAVAAMEALAQQLLALQGTVDQNNQGLKDLADATNANTSATTTSTGAMTGTSSYTYRDQDYLASDRVISVGVGG